VTHPLEAEFPRIRAWIQQEAAARSIDEIRDAIVSRYDTLLETINAIPEAQLAAKPAGEDWGPIDAFKHVVEWNWQVGEDILHVCLTGERPGNPLPQFPADRAELIRRQQESLDSVYAHVSAAEPESFLEITWEHPFFGQLNWREWYFFLGVHAMDHTAQISSLHSALNA
jgi:hypothetical protein